MLRFAVLHMGMILKLIEDLDEYLAPQPGRDKASAGRDVQAGPRRSGRHI